MRYTGWQTDSTMSSTRPCERGASQQLRIGRAEKGSRDKTNKARGGAVVGARAVGTVLGGGGETGAGFERARPLFTRGVDKGGGPGLEAGGYHEGEWEPTMLMALTTCPQLSRNRPNCPGVRSANLLQRGLVAGGRHWPPRSCQASAGLSAHQA